MPNRPSPIRRTVDVDERRTRPLADDVLRLIWRERRISRSEIARRAGLSRSTVSELVSNILATGLVAESGTGPSRGGRRPIVLEFRDDAFGILGVEVGGTHVAVAVTDLRGRVLAWQQRGHDVRGNPESTRALTLELCEAALATWGRPSSDLVGIGIALAAPVDPRRPDLVSPNVLPAWGDSHGLESLGHHFELPVMIDNDANLGALAERWWGLGRDVDDFAYIKVATGIGSGHIVGGRVYRGATGVAGEIGHMAIDPSGQPCVCGLRGCLATLVGRSALLHRARQLVAGQPDHPLSAPSADMSVLEDLALANDPVALQVVAEAAEHLGTAMSGLLNVMNPGMIVLGGDLARLGDILIDPLREHIASKTLLSSMSAAAIEVSDLGPRSVAIGAATMILESALEDSRWFPLPTVASKAQKESL